MDSSHNDKFFVSSPVCIGKIYNCRWVLERTKRDHALRVNSERIAEQSEKLRQALLNARDCTSIDELRGVEGLAAKDYFFAFDGTKIPLQPGRVAPHWGAWIEIGMELSPL